jgi:hypothetical protein
MVFFTLATCTAPLSSGTAQPHPARPITGIFPFAPRNEDDNPARALLLHSLYKGVMRTNMKAIIKAPAVGERLTKQRFGI